MGRSLIIVVLTLFTLVILSMVMPGGVVIEFGLNEFPKRGSVSALTVSIQKGGLDYFGRILLTLPDDCTLVPKDTHGGSFAWDEEQNRAVISWLKLPEADRFDLVFDLQTSPDASIGQRELLSEFSFIRNQDRASVVPPPFLFEINGPANGPAADSLESEVLIEEFAVPLPLAQRTWTQSNEAIELQIEFQGMENGGFTKLSERIPPACDFDVLSAAGGTVQVESAGFSIVWFDGPPDEVVAYRLGQCTLSMVQELSGSLSTIKDGQSLNIDVIPSGMKRSPFQNGDDEVSNGPEIVFEVQFAATKNSVVTDYFEEKFNFRLTTKEENVESWWKYSTGIHEEYAEAKNLRDEIRKNYSFHGPFVIARDDGQRISVQEALMKTGQKWTP